jgi:Alcohol dehydrogenase GroES-like domain
MSSATQQRMKRVVVDHFGGPEVLRVVEEEAPRPGPGEVLVRVLAAGVSFTDAQLRAGTYIPGGPKPPFTPGYELVGVVEELGQPLLAEGGDTFGAIPGAVGDRLVTRLHVQDVVERHAESPVEPRLRQPLRHGRALGQPLGELERLVLELLGGDNAVHEIYPQLLLRVERRAVHRRENQ